MRKFEGKPEALKIRWRRHVAPNHQWNSSIYILILFVLVRDRSELGSQEGGEMISHIATAHAVRHG